MSNKAKIGILAVLLLGVIAGYVMYNNTEYKQDFIKEVNRNLSAEQRKIYEDRLAEAEKKLAEATDDQAKYDWTIQRGFQLYGLGKLSDAQLAFEDAIKIKPGFAGGYVSLFQTQLDRGDNEGALESIQKANQLALENADIWNKYILLQIDRLFASNDKIDALYLEALEKTSNNIDIITSYASWLEKVGNLQGSIDYWKKAMEVKPENKQIYQAEIDRIQKEIERK